MKKFNKVQAIFLATALTVSTGIATQTTYAATASEQKIVVIDLELIVEKSKEVDNFNKKIENQFKPRQDKLISESKILQEKMAEIGRNQTIMSTDQLAEAQDEIIAKRTKLQSEERSFQEDLKLAQARAYRSFMKDVDNAVSAMAKKRGYSLVLRKQAVAYSSDTLDVTPLVLAELSKK